MPRRGQHVKLEASAPPSRNDHHTNDYYSHTTAASSSSPLATTRRGIKNQTEAQLPPPPSYDEARRSKQQRRSVNSCNIAGEIRSRDQLVSDDDENLDSSSSNDDDGGGSEELEEGECEKDEMDHLVERPLTPNSQSGEMSRLSYELSDASINMTPSSGGLYPRIIHSGGSRKSASPSSRGGGGGAVRARTPPSAAGSVSSRSGSHRTTTTNRRQHQVEYMDDLSSSFNQRPARIRHLDQPPNQPNLASFLRNSTTTTWDSGGRTRQWFLALLVPLAALVVYQGANLMMDPKFLMNSRPGPDQVIGRLDDIFESLAVMFPSQPPRIWKILKGGVRPLLLDTAAGDMPKYPAIILLVANSTSRTVTCLSRSLGSKLSRLGLWAAPDCPEVNLNIWRTSLPGVVKLRMDEQTRNAYRNGARCLMLTQLEGVPAEGAKMLHALCDGENAQYLDLVLLMSLVLDKESPLPPFSDDNIRNPEFWRELDRRVEIRLRQMWEAELGVEEMAAIASRIANNIVPLTEETTETLEKVCFH